MNTTTVNPAQDLQGASLSQFLTTLSVAAIIAAIEIIIFVAIRTRFKRIYEPKAYLGDEKRRVKSLPTTLCGWLPALLRMPQEDLIRTSGLDAYFFARYLYIHAFFFLGSFIPIAIVLFPVYAINGKGKSYSKEGLDILTFGNIALHNSSRYVAPLILAYAFICAFLFLLYAEMEDFVEKRQLLLKSPVYQSSADAKTILVTAIPKAYMSHDILFRIFNQFPHGVKYIWLNRNLKDLPDKADMRTKIMEELETVECKLIKSALKDEAKRKKQNESKVHLVQSTGSEKNLDQNIVYKYALEKKRPTMRIGSIPVLSSLCFGKKVDAITYCKQTISQLNNEIEQAKITLDSYAATSSAFIQFNKPIAAHMAVQSVIASLPLAMTPRYNDVKPANIVWSNLNLSYYEKKIRELSMLAANTVLIVFWSIPVALVGVLSNLTYLLNTLTFLEFINNLPSPILGLITGLLPTILLAILMALLPIVLKFFAKTSGLPTTDAIDRYVQGSYFVFQVVHVFLVVTISSSISSTIKIILKDPSKAATILATNVPTASNFFFSFLGLHGLSVASGVLLQIVVLILFYSLGRLFDNTPRKKWKRNSTLSSLSFGTIFPVFTNFVVISLVYSIIAPFVLLISGIAFYLFYIAYIYNLFYVIDFPNDTGGLSFPIAVYQSFSGVYLMEIMLAGLFFLAQDEFGNQSAVVEGVFMCVLILITVGVQLSIRSSFNHLTHYLPVDCEEFSRLQIPVSRASTWMKKAKNVLNSRETNGDTDVVCNINDAVIEKYDGPMESTYMHPAILDQKPTVWIPEDNLGIAADEIQRTLSSGLDISMSSEGARFNEKISIEVNGPPPNHT